jgi:hypothetical protein
MKTFDDMHEALKKYMYDKTRGLVRLTPVESRAIEDIVRGKAATAKLWKFNQALRLYQLIRDVLAKQLPGSGPKGFLRWDLEWADGTSAGSIYSLNPDLFDK